MSRVMWPWLALHPPATSPSSSSDSWPCPCCSSCHKSLSPAYPLRHNLVPSKTFSKPPPASPILTKKRFVLNPVDMSPCHSAVRTVCPPGSCGSLTPRSALRTDVTLHGGLDGEDHAFASLVYLLKTSTKPLPWYPGLARVLANGHL